MPRSARPARLAALVALAAVAAAGCTPYVQGNGVYREENRTPSQTFQGIHVEDGIEATITAGAAQPKVVVSGDANLVPYIETEVVSEPAHGQVLHVRIEVPGGTWSITIPPRIVVELGELQYAYAASSQVTASAVATQLLSIEASEKSNVLVSGPGGGRIQVVASGASVDAGSYPVSDDAHVDLSAGARAELHSDGAVTGTVRAGCTLDNLLGSGTCAGVLVPAGDVATIQCNPAP